MLHYITIGSFSERKYKALGIDMLGVFFFGDPNGMTSSPIYTNPKTLLDLEHSRLT